MKIPQEYQGNGKVMIYKINNDEGLQYLPVFQAEGSEPHQGKQAKLLRIFREVNISMVDPVDKVCRKLEKGEIEESEIETSISQHFEQ